MRAAAAARPRLLQAVIDAFRQPDVRQKILFTLSLLVLFRFTANLPVPGIDADQLRAIFESNAVLGFLNIFSGNALRNMSVAAMGVYPYVTASIVMQLLVPIVPSLQALTKEGEQGRRQIQIYTHWMTVPMALVQGYGTARRGRAEGRVAFERRPSSSARLHRSAAVQRVLSCPGRSAFDPQRVASSVSTAEPRGSRATQGTSRPL